MKRLFKLFYMRRVIPRVDASTRASHRMDAIASAATQDAEVSQSLDEDAASASKRAKMTNDRIQLVANTLMEEGNMRQYGLILKSTAKGHSAKGSKEQLSKFAQFLNAKNHPVLQGCHLGVDALQNWIKQMRNYATTEAARALARPPRASSPLRLASAGEHAL